MLKLRECCATVAFIGYRARTFGCNQYSMQGDKKAFSEEFTNKLRYFIQDNDALRASRNARAVFFDCLRFQQGNLDTHFDDILNDVEATIKLLELIAGESKEWRDKLA